VAFQSLPSGCTGGAKLTATAARRRDQVPSRSTERAPRSATGTTGTPACAAAWKAPARNAISPGRRWKVPSGNTMSETPRFAAAARSPACATLFCTSKRSTNSAPMPLRKMRVMKLPASSRLATKAKGRAASAAIRATPSR